MNKSEQLIACLEGEIAKRDETIARLEPQLNRAIQANYDLREELAACRVAIENCEVFRARIVELESQYQRDVCGLNNEGDPIGGEPAGGYANDNARLRAELAALKAQEPVAWAGAIGYGVPLLMVEPQNWKATPLYAAPVSEVKAQDWRQATDGGRNPRYEGLFDGETEEQRASRLAAHRAKGVVIPEGWIPLTIEHEPGYPEDVAFGPKRMMDRLKKWLDRYFEMRLNAAPAAPAADAGLSLAEWAKDANEWGGALNYAAWEFVNECPEKSALLFNNTKGPLRAAIMKYAEIVAAHRANGVV